jgi:hypothetical protein
MLISSRIILMPLWILKSMFHLIRAWELFWDFMLYFHSLPWIYGTIWINNFFYRILFTSIPWISSLWNNSFLLCRRLNFYSFFWNYRLISICSIFSFLKPS